MMHILLNLRSGYDKPHIRTHSQFVSKGMTIRIYGALDNSRL